MGELRVLSSGVDTLHLIVRGAVRDEVGLRPMTLGRRQLMAIGAC